MKALHYITLAWICMIFSFTLTEPSARLVMASVGVIFSGLGLKKATKEIEK